MNIKIFENIDININSLFSIKYIKKFDKKKNFCNKPKELNNNCFLSINVFLINF